MTDELVGGYYTLNGRLGLLVCEVGDKHAIERALAHTDHILLTEVAPGILARQQEASLVAQLSTAVTVAGGQ